MATERLTDFIKVEEGVPCIESLGRSENNMDFL
jgi:hypothetical protein